MFGTKNARASSSGYSPPNGFLFPSQGSHTLTISTALWASHLRVFSSSFFPLFFLLRCMGGLFWQAFFFQGIRQTIDHPNLLYIFFSFLFFSFLFFSFHVSITNESMLVCLSRVVTDHEVGYATDLEMNKPSGSWVANLWDRMRGIQPQRYVPIHSLLADQQSYAKIEAEGISHA